MHIVCYSGENEALGKNGSGKGVGSVNGRAIMIEQIEAHTRWGGKRWRLKQREKWKGGGRFGV